MKKRKTAKLIHAEPKLSTFILAMKLSIFFLIVSLQAYSRGFSQETFSLSVKNVELKTLFSIIQNKTSYRFLYYEGIIPTKLKVDVEASNARLEQVLDKALTKTSLQYRIMENNLVVISSGTEVAPDITIKGTISDDKGVPLAGATVKVKGATSGTETSATGAFSIKVPPHSTLVISHVGYESKEFVVEKDEVLNVKLSLADKALEDVVVTALGVKRDRRSLGYAVSTIKGDELQVAGETLNPFLAIYGKASGVGVNIGAGGPIGGIRINIRGAASMNPNANVRPLFVVDGVILTDKSSSLGSGVNSFDYGSGINDINSEDIESMEILKGAKATVLYGSDAANGVVLITTKSGRNTRGFGMTGSFQQTLEKPVSYLKLQNEYGIGDDIYDTSYATLNGQQVRQIPLKRFSFGPKFDGADVLFWDSSMVKNVAHPNNYNSLFQNGHSTSANVAISGSSDKGSMRASYTNYNYQDISSSSSWQRRNTFSFSGNIKASKLASFELVANIYNVSTQNRRGGNGGSVAWGYPSDFDYGKIWPLYTDATGYKRDLTNYGVTNALSIIGGREWQYAKDRYKDDALHFITSAKVTMNFTKNIFLVGQAGLDYNNTTYTTETSVARIVPNVAGGGFSYAKENATAQTYQALLNYDKSFKNNDFHIFAFAGGVYKLLSSDYLGSSTVGSLIYPSWYSFANDGGVISPGNGYLVRNFNRGSNVLYSALGSATFSWKNEFYLELQGRQDWNSTLPPANNKYFYPGASITWNYTERFSIPAMNRGQFRASWADVGNGTGRYQANNQYSFGVVQGSSAVTVTPPSTILPGALLPERKREFEVGISNTFFKNDRVGFDLSFYTNNRYHQIVPGLPISTSSSSTGLTVNTGNVRQTGYEIALTLKPFVEKNWGWSITINAASQSSKVIQVYPGVPAYPYLNLIGQVSAWATEGQKLGEIKMFDYQRDSSGNKIVGSNGLYSLNTQKFVNTANIYPKVFGGVLSDFQYKGFNFRIGLDYKFGGTIFSITNNYLTGNGEDAKTLQYRDQAHGGMAYYVDGSGNFVPWQHNNAAPAQSADGKVYHDGLILSGVSLNSNTGKYEKNTTLTSATNYYETYINDLYQYWPPDHVYKNDYIKVREVALSYTLPKGLSSKMKLQKLTFTLAARNLFYLYKTVPNIDPEGALGADSFVENTIYPSQRTYSFGLNVAF